jgi:hypothetical protein
MTSVLVGTEEKDYIDFNLNRIYNLYELVNAVVK